MGDYPQLLFAKHWEISPEIHYEVGQCRAIISAIREMPLRPEYYLSMTALRKTGIASLTQR